MVSSILITFNISIFCAIIHISLINFAIIIFLTLFIFCLLVEWLCFSLYNWGISVLLPICHIIFNNVLFIFMVFVYFISIVIYLLFKDTFLINKKGTIYKMYHSNALYPKSQIRDFIIICAFFFLLFLVLLFTIFLWDLFFSIVIVLMLYFILFIFYLIFNFIYYNSFVLEFTNMFVIFYINNCNNFIFNMTRFFISIIIFFCFAFYALIGLNNIFSVMYKWEIFTGDGFVLMLGRGGGELPGALGDSQGGPSNPNKRPNTEMEGASMEEDNRKKRSRGTIPNLSSLAQASITNNPLPEVDYFNPVNPENIGIIKANISFVIDNNKIIIFATNDDQYSSLIHSIHNRPAYSAYPLQEFRIKTGKKTGIWLNDFTQANVRKDNKSDDVIDIANGFNVRDNIKTRNTPVHISKPTITIKGRNAY